MEKREPSCTAGRNVNYTITVENSMAVPQKLKIELPYDPPVPLLGIYLEKVIIQKVTCTTVFIAA